MLILFIADPTTLLLADKRSPAPKRTYASDPAGFFKTLGFEQQGQVPDPTAVQAFLQPSAHEVALKLATYKPEMPTKPRCLQNRDAYKTEMLVAGLPEAIVSRSIAAVRSLLKFSYRLGLAKTAGHGLAETDGRGLADSKSVQSYRNTRGTDLTALRRLLILPAELHGPGTLRDAALLGVLAENALRQAEVMALNVVELSLTEKHLSILGK